MIKAFLVKYKISPGRAILITLFCLGLYALFYFFTPKSSISEYSSSEITTTNNNNNLQTITDPILKLTLLLEEEKKSKKKLTEEFQKLIQNEKEKNVQNDLLQKEKLQRENEKLVTLLELEREKNRQREEEQAAEQAAEQERLEAILLQNRQQEEQASSEENKQTIEVEPKEQSVESTVNAPMKNNNNNNNDNNNYVATILIPTDCTEYSDWLSIISILSLEKLKEKYPEQNFKIWRLVACNKTDHKEFEHFHNRYITTELSPFPYGPMKGMEFACINKAWSLYNFLFNGPGQDIPDNEEIFVSDPDFLYIRPLPIGQSRFGRGAASPYQIGPRWFLEGQDFPTPPGGKAFCKGNKNCDITSETFIKEYNSGAPYILRARDLKKIVPYWHNFTVDIFNMGTPGKGYSWPGGWLADMYAFMIGTIIEGIKYTQMTNLMHSNAEEVCGDPAVLHLCSTYSLEMPKFWAPKKGEREYKMKWNKHNYHNRKLLSCNESEVMQALQGSVFDPPPGLYAEQPPDIYIKKDTEQGLKDRKLWFLWQIYHHFPLLLAEYRKRFCPTE